MYTAQIKNSNVESLDLTQNEANWQVLSITGLNPAPAQINTTNIAGLDGARFNSSKLNTKNIVIMLRINGDVETNRQNLYRFFKTKDNCTFYYANTNRNVSIDGYVETVECNLFSNSEIMQISILCPFPYFKALEEILVDISNETAAFTFPFSINENEPIPFSDYIDNRITNIVNRSESETGVKITIDVFNSVEEIVIRKVDTGETITLNYSFLAQDRIIIETQRGQKSIILIRTAVKTNLFSAMKKGSVLFQLTPGSNHFGYSIDDGAGDADVDINFSYSALYRGV